MSCYSEQGKVASIVPPIVRGSNTWRAVSAMMQCATVRENFIQLTWPFYWTMHENSLPLLFCFYKSDLKTVRWHPNNFLSGVTCRLRVRVMGWEATRKWDTGWGARCQGAQQGAAAWHWCHLLILGGHTAHCRTFKFALKLGEFQNPASLQLARRHTWIMNECHLRHWMIPTPLFESLRTIDLAKHLHYYPHYDQFPFTHSQPQRSAVHAAHAANHTFPRCQNSHLLNEVSKNDELSSFIDFCHLTVCRASFLPQCD